MRGRLVAVGNLYFLHSLTTMSVAEQPKITRIGGVLCLVLMPVVGIGLNTFSFPTSTYTPLQVRIVQALFSNDALQCSLV